jgi:hypothetical protein
MEMAGGRLFVRLDYPDGGSDKFEWQVFSQTEMAVFARSAGLALESSSTGYGAGSGLGPNQPRIQFVLKKPARP